MRARLEMELEDVPGQLIKVLEPISNFGANIQNIVHKREEKTPLGKVPITVLIEVENKELLDKIVDKLEELGARIIRVGEEKAATSTVILLVGDILQTDIQDSVLRLNSIDGASISNLSMAIGEADEENSARVIIEAKSDEVLQETVSKMKNIANEKGLLLIETLG